MTTSLLPSVNFDSTPGYNEWSFLHKVYSEEFFTRSQISCNPGIVDLTGDPAAAPFDSTRPLFVSVNQSNTLTMDLTAGFAVTPSHKLIVLNSGLSAIPLPDVVVDRIYVMYLEYKLLESEEKRLNRFKNVAEVRIERPSNEPFGGEASTLSQVASVVSLTDFSNPSLFPEDRLRDIVVLAVAVVRADSITGQLSLLIDLTRTTFDFNRPWFSTVDAEHRSRVGSGLVTENNIHGIALQDLSSAGFTLFQQLLSRGGVFSKDTTYYGYPGTFCTELVSINRYQTDTTGTVTEDPTVELDALSGRYFVTLTRVPVRVGSLYRTGEPWKPIPYYWKPGTRYLVLASLEQPLLYGSSLTFEYFSVNALMPPQEPLDLGVQSFEVGEPVSSVDYIISGGLALDSLNQSALNLSASAGPIKKEYQVICNSDGTLSLSPQNLVPVMRVRDLVAQNQITVDQSPLNGAACRLTIGLTGVVESLTTAPGFDLNLKIRINGQTTGGSTIEEDIIFKASQWRKSADGLKEEPMQFRYTKNQYEVLNFVQILNTTSDPDNAGSDAIISIWANILEASANQELANIASFFWDGSGGRRITDKRLIATSTQRDDQRSYKLPNLLPENDASFVQELFSVLLDPPLTNPNNHSRRLALELDHDRSISDTWKVFSSLDSTGRIQPILFSLITNGMTLRLSEDKFLKFVSTAPNASKGEVLIPTSLITGDLEIKNNLISTINNPLFDSTWFAEAGNTDIALSRAMAYPEGFVVSRRLKMQFSGVFTVGQIDFTVNGVPISSVTSTGDHVDTLDLIVEAINDISDLTGGVTAVHIPEALSYIMFNGPVSGLTFNVTTPIFTGAIVTAGISEPADAFILTQPTNGTLPTNHLPDRFLSAERFWEYQSVALPWSGVKLQASISFFGNVATNIQNLDQIEIIPGKILIARRGVSAEVTREIGEFLVTPADLTATLTSMRDTVNNEGFRSGVQAEVSGNSLLLNIGGYATAQIQLLVESVPDTWVINPYIPTGIGSSGSTGFLKAIHDLTSAEWRYQLIQAASSIGSFAPGDVNAGSDTVTLTSHGLHNGDNIFIQSTGTPPQGLNANQNYFVINSSANTFQLASILNGPAVDIFTGGTGTHTLFLNAPYGPGQWSPFQPMEKVSNSAYKFSGPVSTSLYCIQLRLKGEKGIANGFSLYQLSPEVSGATLGQLDTRVTDIENEIDDARGSTPVLADRLLPTINLDGSRVQDPELTNTHASTILPNSSVLKSRLDVADGLMYWLTGDHDNYLNPAAMGNKGIANQLISGPSDLQGNSNFFLAASPSNFNLKITAGNVQPLIVAIDGNYYRFARDHLLNFSGQADGTYYIYAEVRDYSSTFLPADVDDAADEITIPIHGLKVGDTVRFSSSGTLPGGLSAATNYYVNTATVNTFKVSAINYGPMTTVDLTSIGSGTHTVSLINQELGQTVYAGTVSTNSASGSSIVESATLFPLVDPLIADGTPLVISIPSMAVGSKTFYSPIVGTVAPNQVEISGQLPATLVTGTYFEIRSYKEASFTFSTTRTETSKKLCIGQVSWGGGVVSNARNYRYQNKYVSPIQGPYTAGVNYTATFNHNLGKLPGNFKLYFHTSPTGDAEPVLVENDAIFSVSATQINVINRYDSVIVKDYTRTNQNTGYLQLII